MIPKKKARGVFKKRFQYEGAGDAYYFNSTKEIECRS